MIGNAPPSFCLDCSPNLSQIWVRKGWRSGGRFPDTRRRFANLHLEGQLESEVKGQYLWYYCADSQRMVLHQFVRVSDTRNV